MPRHRRIDTIERIPLPKIIFREIPRIQCKNETRLPDTSPSKNYEKSGERDFSEKYTRSVNISGNEWNSRLSPNWPRLPST